MLVDRDRKLANKSGLDILSEFGNDQQTTGGVLKRRGSARGDAQSPQREQDGRRAKLVHVGAF